MPQFQILDLYQEGNSVVHRLDSRVKFVLTLAFIVAITALPPGAWSSYLLCLLTIGLIVGLSRVHPLIVLRRSMVAVLFATAALTLIFTVEGTTLATLGLGRWSLPVTAEGIIAFASILTKAWLSVLTATMLVATTSFPDLVAGMRALRVPRVIVSVVSFMYRYIFVIADEALRLHRAREARSASPDRAAARSLFWRAKVLGGMVGSLFLRSYERSERVYAAMLSRGFDGHIRSMGTRALGRGDFVIAGAFLAYLLAIVALSRLQLGA